MFMYVRVCVCVCVCVLLYWWDLTISITERMHPQKSYPGYDTKLHLVVRFHFWSSVGCQVTPLCVSVI